MEKDHYNYYTVSHADQVYLSQQCDIKLILDQCINFTGNQRLAGGLSEEAFIPKWLLDP